ncbi:MAG: type II secretion system protein M [Syntrophobacterales bacterium]|nr:type II secretion system protein M [Syntrophobacterales bacterium]
MSPWRRRLVLAGGAMAAVLLLWVLVLSPLVSLEEAWTRELRQKQLLLARYQALKRDKAEVAKAAQQAKQAVEQAEAALLRGGSAAVASADLQEIIKNLTKALGIQVTSTKVLPPQESGPYIQIPVELQLALSTDQLVNLLYGLENHQKLLVVSQLEVNAPRRRRPVAGSPMAEPAPLRAVLVVEGIIKKGAGA